MIRLLVLLAVARAVVSAGVIFLREDHGHGHRKLSEIRGGGGGGGVYSYNRKQDPQNVSPGALTTTTTTQPPYIFNTRTNIFDGSNGSLVPTRQPQQPVNNSGDVGREELIARWALGLLIALFVVFVISSVLSIIWCILVRCGIKPNWCSCCYCCDRYY